jgi:hypothetical protein
VKEIEVFEITDYPALPADRQTCAMDVYSTRWREMQAGAISMQPLRAGLTRADPEEKAAESQSGKGFWWALCDGQRHVGWLGGTGDAPGRRRGGSSKANWRPVGQAGSEATRV